MNQIATPALTPHLAGHTLANVNRMIADDAFVTWAKDQREYFNGAAADDLNVLDEIASEIARHHRWVADKCLALTLAGAKPYSAVEQAAIEVETLEWSGAVCPEASRVLAVEVAALVGAG